MGNAPKRCQKSDAPKTPWKKTHALPLFAAIGKQAEQSLQRTIEQSGMKQIGIEGLVDDRRIEVHDGAVRTGQLDAVHCLKAIAVIKTDALGETIKRPTVDLTSGRLTISPTQDWVRVG